jgi:hypothetical protein
MQRGTSSSDSTMTMVEMVEGVLINGTRIKVVLALEVIMARQEVKATTPTTQGGGRGNPNLQYGNVGGGYKRGTEEREVHGDQRERDFRSKLRDHDSRRMGAGRPSHCFNCNRDGHF